MFFLAAIESTKPTSSEVFVESLIEEDYHKRWLEAYIKKYSNHLEDTIFSSDEKTLAWTSRQTYIVMEYDEKIAIVKGNWL